MARSRPRGAGPDRLASPLGHTWSAAVWAGLWILYLSFVNVGQIFYAFGWESLLLETGVLAIFAGGSEIAPGVFLIWMLRWVMFGAGLIKLRGDPCWRDLTCLDYYFETQPIPNPLSWDFHRLPAVVWRAGVLFNHAVEVAVPRRPHLPPAHKIRRTARAHFSIETSDSPATGHRVVMSRAHPVA